MIITEKQYKCIEQYLPTQRGNVSIENQRLINAILYIAENGCKWRALPESYGKWYTVYKRVNRRTLIFSTPKRANCPYQCRTAVAH
ncbi:MAG: transposase [Syntrophobacterales bacterium]|nr:transposase [Syntrophobacterales bacterium]